MAIRNFQFVIPNYSSLARVWGKDEQPQTEE